MDSHTHKNLINSYLQNSTPMTLFSYETTPDDKQPDPYTPLVRQIMRVDEITWGQDKQKYLVRYRGQLVSESRSAYDKLSAALKNLDITPLFRNEEGKHTVI